MLNVDNHWLSGVKANVFQPLAAELKLRAEACGNSALAARVIADRLYPGKTISEMTESEKQTVTTLSLLAGGLAAGTVGDSTTNAVAGAQASQNAVENNLFYLALSRKA